jgi:hypothetical protein
MVKAGVRVVGDAAREKLIEMARSQSQHEPEHDAR